MKVSALALKLVVAVVAATTVLHASLKTEAATGQRIVIEIRDLAFLPGSPAVSPGDVVVWKNMDIVPHTVTAKDDSWDSGLIKTGEQWEVTISDEMIETYYCRFHPSMIAKLNIEPE